MAVVTELVTKFSFKGSTAPLGDFNKALGGSVVLIGKMIGALVATSTAINAFVITTLSSADALAQLSINTGIAFSRLQELGFIASVSGSSAQALQTTMMGLSQTIGQAAQKGNEDFQRLGISVRDSNGQVKNADTILREVSGRFKALGLSMQEQQGFAQALGIDASLLQMMGKTSSELLALEKRARSFGLVTEDQRGQIIDFNDSLTMMRFGLGAVKDQIAIGLSPAIKDMAIKFADLIRENKDFIISVATTFGEGINVMIDALVRLAPVLIGVGLGLLALKISAIGFGAVLGVIFSPVVLITAGIVLLLAIIDDLIVAMQGGESVIRDFFMTFFDFDITPLLQGWRDAFTEFIDDVIGQFKELWGWIQKINPGKIASDFGGKVSGLFGFGDGGTTNNSSVAQDVKIEINTNDPAAAGQAVGDSLQGQLEKANVHFNRGGR